MLDLSGAAGAKAWGTSKRHAADLLGAALALRESCGFDSGIKMGFVTRASESEV